MVYTLVKKAAVAATVTAFAGTLAACGGSSDAEGTETLTWRAAWYVGPGHPSYDDGAEVFKEKAESDPDTDIEVDLYPSEQLGKVGDSLNILETDVADEAFTSPGYHQEQLPLLAAWDLPLGRTQEEIVEARWAAAHQEGPFVEQMRAAGLVPLLIHATPNPEFSTLSSPLGSPDALKGLQIRVPNENMVQAVRRFGAVGVTGPSSELFETLQRGVVDGTIYYYGSFDTVGIDTLMKHGTENAKLPPSIVGSFVTAETWEALTEEQQRAIYQAAREASIQGSKTLMDETAAELEGLQAKGLQLHSWSESDVDRFYAELEVVVQNWIDSQGEDAQAAVDEVRALTGDIDANDDFDLMDDFDAFAF